MVASLLAFGILGQGLGDSRAHIAWSPKVEERIRFRTSSGFGATMTSSVYLRFEAEVVATIRLPNGLPTIEWREIHRVGSKEVWSNVEKLGPDTNGNLPLGKAYFDQTPVIWDAPFRYAPEPLWPGEGWMGEVRRDGPDMQKELGGVTVYTYKYKTLIDGIECYEVTAETKGVRFRRPFAVSATYWLRTSDGSLERVRLGTIPAEESVRYDEDIRKAPHYFHLDRIR